MCLDKLDLQLPTWRALFGLPCSLHYQQKSHFSSLDKAWSLFRQLGCNADQWGWLWFCTWAAQQVPSSLFMTSIATHICQVKSSKQLSYLRPRPHGAVASKRWENADHNHRLAQPFGTQLPKRNPAYGKVLRGLLMGEVWWKYIRKWRRMLNEWRGCMFYPISKVRLIMGVESMQRIPWRCSLCMGDSLDIFIMHGRGAGSFLQV